jgi:asparagine synthase (glutamine-hydrolysing)
VLTTLRIDPDAPQDWAWDGTRYTALGGVIEPYAHPMTEHAAVTDGTRTTVILRERTRHRPGLRPELARVASRELDQVTAMARQWPGDYLLIEAERYRPVRVTAGAARTTPLYLAHSGGVLHGSWDMGWLRQFAAGLNPKEATRMLAYHPRYSYETAFTGIWRLTERAAATFGGDLYVRYPEPVPHATPRELADSADVLTAFAQAIDAALDLRPRPRDDDVPPDRWPRLRVDRGPGRPPPPWRAEHRHPGHHRPRPGAPAPPAFRDPQPPPLRPARPGQATAGRAGRAALRR